MVSYQLGPQYWIDSWNAVFGPEHLIPDVEPKHAAYGAAAVGSAWFLAWILKTAGEYIGPYAGEAILQELTGTEAIF